MDAINARSHRVRFIFADVLNRSFGGLKPALRLRGELDLRVFQEEEITWRIKNELGVTIPLAEWRHFNTVADVISFVEVRSQAVEAV